MKKEIITMRNIKLVASILACMTIFTSFAGCSKKGGFDASREITVISREEGSGTRGAFVELFGIERKNENGEKVDYTVPTADITQSTGVMIASVSQNAHAIGYISLGSLNDSVKALRIDGAAATVENIKNGSYKISRPFNIVTKENLTEAAKDFINFILSETGKKSWNKTDI
jgi:phosphate transport system substrate-binding protein